jgi:hypothetical protein
MSGLRVEAPIVGVQSTSLPYSNGVAGPLVTLHWELLAIDSDYARIMGDFPHDYHGTSYSQWANRGSNSAGISNIIPINPVYVRSL